ncbi:MAG TPA: hypothetical protein DEB40_13645 [Elusimicrobia bacterium]|nr:hypothetical protein [Elusimicrobiota bacterium]HBT62777.1 hypothetical protein [Elusimicrobiota bacterium]
MKRARSLRALGAFAGAWLIVSTARLPLFSQPVRASISGRGSGRAVPILPAIKAAIGQASGSGKTLRFEVSPPASPMPQSRALRPIPTGETPILPARPIAGIKTARPGAADVGQTDRIDFTPAVPFAGEEHGQDNRGVSSSPRPDPSFISQANAILEARSVATESKSGVVERARQLASTLLGGLRRGDVSGQVQCAGLAVAQKSPPTGENIPESKKVILLLTVLDERKAFTHGKTRALKMEYRLAYPRRRIAVVEGKTREQVLSRLKTALHDGEKISHLAIGTHGRFDLFTEGTGTLLARIGGVYARTRPPYTGVVDTNFHEFFAPIRGRLLDEASITLIACDVFAGRARDAFRRSEAIFDYFGLRNGRISGADMLSKNSIPTLGGPFVAEVWLTLASGLISAAFMIFVVISHAPLAMIGIGALILPAAIVIERILEWAFPEKVTGFLIRRVNGHLGKIERVRLFRRSREYLGIIRK